MVETKLMKMYASIEKERKNKKQYYSTSLFNFHFYREYQN